MKNHFTELEPHLPEIVPLLNDYLAEVDSSGGDQLPGAAGDEVAENTARKNTGDMTRTQARRQREARAKDMQVGDRRVCGTRAVIADAGQRFLKLY